MRWTLAVGCAISVGNLYLMQPLLAQVAASFQVTERQAGLCATLNQVGYALGMLTLVPLGDVRERRGLALVLLGACALMALANALAPTYPLLLAASLGLGIATCTPQILLPFAAALAPPEARGRTVGFVMSGLLLGILLARTVSGFVGAHAGWRGVYLLSAGLSVGLALLLRFVLPTGRQDGPPLTYGRLFRSLGALVRDEPVLRESAAYGALLFAAFSAFWTTLSFRFAAPPFGMDPRAAGELSGLFGLVGAVGALAAPLVGRQADAGRPRRTILAAVVLTAVSFAVMLPPSIPLLVVGVLLMDVGVQAAQVSNQSRVYALRPEARSRLNTVYMTAYFTGGSLGSALGAWAWDRFGWPGVCAVGALCALVAGGVWATTRGSRRR